MKQVRDGFSGQRMVVFPAELIRRGKNQPIARDLYATDVGYFPKAQFHFVDRPSGSRNHILIHCTKGKGWLRTDRTTSVLQENDLIMIPRGTPHRYGANISDPWTICWLHLNGESAEEYLGLLFGKRLRVTVPATDESQRIFDEILDNASNAFSDPGYLVLSGSIQYYLTVLAYARRADRHHSRKSEERVIECIEYLTGHLSAPHTLASLSARTNMSVPHLSYLFKQRTGVSPMRYLTRMRIRRACELLDATDKAIKDIAYEVGYEDPFYFTRIFRSAVGASPRAYREAVKG